MSDLTKSKNRLNLSISRLSSYNFCLDILEIDYGKLEKVVAVNIQNELIKVTYKCIEKSKSVNKKSHNMRSANGSFGMLKIGDIRNMQDNRNGSIIPIVEINCN